MAELELKYYDNIDRYSDGAVEDDIYKIIKNGTGIPEGEKRYAVLYHLSEIRENILNWYPFKENSAILEIGSGCGAITGLLCRKAEKVVSVELSKKRASINYHRHKDYENLKIYVGNLNDMEFEQSFDYIVLNGVLEYAMSFTETDDPYVTFLRNIQKFLKKDGIVLIAIENRLGLRYFTGYPEEHMNDPFLGLKGYEGNCQVRTFSKSELQELLTNAGFAFRRFYYPYPDYKFPNEIFTDEFTKGYGKPYLNLCQNRFQTFEEGKLAPVLEKEGVIGNFSNSFLVEASIEKQDDNIILYAKLNMDRASKFQTATVIGINGRKYVKKMPLFPEAGAHLDHMMLREQAEETDNIHFVPMTKQGTDVYMPFIEGESFEQEIERWIKQKKATLVLDEIHKFFDAYFAGKRKDQSTRSDYNNADFTAVFGEAYLDRKLACVKYANIDLILDNIFRGENGYTIIDCEWVFDFDIPETFIVWRTLNELYSRQPSLDKQISRSEAMMQFGIDQRMEAAFWNWATFFVNKYVGGGNLEAFVEPITWLDINKAAGPKMCSSLYLDTGAGYSEENKLYAESWIKQGKYELTYILPDLCTIKRLRWDPEEEKPCICTVHVYDGDVELNVHSYNRAWKENDGEVFLDADPGYEIEIDKLKSRKLKIKGNIQFLDAQSAVNAARKENQKRHMGSSLYVDYGSGYCEAEKIYQESDILNGEYDFYFNLPDDREIRELRWDPEEKQPCICTMRVFSHEKELFPRCVGETERMEQGDLFLNPDPYYLISGKNLQGKTLHIFGRIRFLEAQEAVDWISEASSLKVQRYQWIAEEQKKITEQEISELKKVFEQKERDFELEKTELRRLCAQQTELLHNMQQTRGWRVLEKLRKVKCKLTGK